MSRFSNLFRGRVAAAHDTHFARPVSLTSPGSDAITTPCVVHRARIITRPSSGGGTETVAVCKARFTLLESIRHDAIVTIDDQRWSIQEVATSDTPGIDVTLIRTLASEVARDQYRR